MGKILKVRSGRTKEGEPIAVAGDDQELVAYAAGEGKMRRGAVAMGELLGRTLMGGQVASKEAEEKMDEEMGVMGGKRVGRDSPETERSAHGWTREFGDRYGEIFGHEEPKI